MKLYEGAQVVSTIFSEPQQFTVKHVAPGCAVHVQSNIQPLSMVLWPTEYRVGVTLTKLV